MLMAKGRPKRGSQVKDDPEVPKEELARLHRQYQQAMSDIIYLFKSGRPASKGRDLPDLASRSEKKSFLALHVAVEAYH